MIRCSVPGMSVEDVRAWLHGLPEAPAYDVIVRPLRYRSRPHLAAYTEFDEKRITIQVPEPFLPFGEIVHWGAKRVAARGLRFVWLSAGVTFRTRREVVRFLWLHEWYHTYLKNQLGRKSSAETACDRFALRNYRKRTVTLADAAAALRR